MEAAGGGGGGGGGGRGGDKFHFSFSFFSFFTLFSCYFQFWGSLGYFRDCDMGSKRIIGKYSRFSEPRYYGNYSHRS